MAAQHVSTSQPRAAVSVSGMAKLVGLSRSRFYDYVRRGVFPQPIYSVATHRPLFPAELQQETLAVRQSGIGTNGEYVLFYEKHERVDRPQAKPIRPAPHDRIADLLAGLQSLGLTNVRKERIDQAIAANFPHGIGGVDDSMVLRTVYRYLRRAGVG